MKGNIGSAWIGAESKPVRNEVEKGAIRKFADAIGDPNPLYRDEEYARSTPYGTIVAPPTFSRTLDYGTIEGLQYPREGLIHGEQQFEYFQPIVAGMVLYCSTKLADVYVKNGKSGTMTFLVFEQKGVDEQGNLVFRARSNIIMRGEPI
jgi:acyl dehydratase